MCVACVEFVKETLTFKEFKSALQEVTREDEHHLQEVERVLRSVANDPEKSRQKLGELKKR